MDALVAIAGSDQAAVLAADTARMLDAIWPGASRQEASYVDRGISLRTARQDHGAAALGLPRLRRANHVVLAQRFDWTSLDPTTDPIAAWLAEVATDGPNVHPRDPAVGAAMAWVPDPGALVVLRDAMGEAPFWYAHAGDRLAVASHPAALLALDWVSAEPDPGAGPGLVGLVGPDRSWWRHIRRLPAGHLLRYAAGRATVEPWWRVPTPEPAPGRSDEDWYRTTRQALERAVVRRIPIHGPVGAQLSGGLDSTAVTLLASGALVGSDRAIHTFSHLPAVCWHPPGPGDETPYVEAALGAIPNAVPHFAIGVGPPATTVANHRLAPHDTEVRQAAGAAGVVAMLSGWGGDEGVSYNGDGFLAAELLRGRFRSVLSWCWAFGGRTLRGTAATFYTKVVMQQLGLLRATPVHPHPGHDLTRLLGTLPRSERQAARAQARITRRLRRATGSRINQRRLLASPHLSARIEEDTLWSVPAGFVFRYPLLDPDLLATVLSAPERLFVAGGRTRTLMRHAMRDLYPELIERRRGKFVSHPKTPDFRPVTGTS